MKPGWLVPAAVLATLPGTSLGAQAHHAPGDAPVVALIREAVEPYADRRQAIAAGYRRIGPDFPGMGEHWVQVPLLVRGVLDLARPAILTYATIDGRVTLTGVGYAVAVAADDTLPGDFAGGHAAWHVHTGSVADESFLPAVHHARQTDGLRLAVTHAWVRLPNPDGTWATDNWALPWVRAGLTPPARPDPHAARALAAAMTNRDYYRVRWRRLGVLTADGVERLLAEHAAAVRRLLARTTDPEARDRALAAEWRATCPRTGDACAAHARH